MCCSNRFDNTYGINGVMSINNLNSQMNNPHGGCSRGNTPTRGQVNQLIDLCECIAKDTYRIANTDNNHGGCENNRGDSDRGCGNNRGGCGCSDDYGKFW